MENLIKNYKGNSIPKIDMHVHYLPKTYREALLNSGEENPDGFPTPEWNLEMHLEAMKHLGISTSMLSISSPHINFGDKNAAKILARKVNEDAAELVKRYPDKFGLLASLPLPNVEDSIEEIKYAKDVLHADGFALPTNTQEIYLGNPCLDPIFEELNRYKAVVVLHPNKPSSVPKNVVEGLPIPMMEFFFDTTRTVINMILKGTLKRFQDIKFVIPHAGAFLSILADRIVPALQITPDSFGDNIKKEEDRIDVFDVLKGLYYDIAGACLPRQLTDLLQIVDVNNLLYGSDYPYTPEVGCIALAAALDKTDLLTDEQRCAIYRDNALKLFPRLK
ncbi:amidohydrolase family protein [Clostridium pasteurianum]|nr:amidohydrolase family protein [Clostridium pasteurianum]